MTTTQNSSHRWKRHTETEISAKLARASELAAAGAIQKDIAETLGISVMTYHRWRKSLRQRAMPEESSRPVDPDGAGRAAELQLENSLLRRLVTDLLLEKVELEEQAGRAPASKLLASLS